MKKLTCVTATFNCIKAGNRQRLIRCVESVAKLKTEHEHLIFDGASADGTVELLRELAETTQGLKVVSAPDAGIYNALNKGVRAAQGEWFYVLGADDYIFDPSWLDKLLEDIGPSTTIIVAPVRRDNGLILFRKLLDLSRIFWDYPYSHQGVVMRTSTIKRYGGFDERYVTCADWNLFFTCHKNGEVHKYVFRPFTYYAQGGFSENPRNAEAINIGFHDVRKKVLDLTDLEYMRFRQYGFVSVKKIVKLILHKDLAFRLSGVRMVWNVVRHCLKTLRILGK